MPKKLEVKLLQILIKEKLISDNQIGCLGHQLLKKSFVDVFF